jgi:hypothetical protein
MYSEQNLPCHRNEMSVSKDYFIFSAEKRNKNYMAYRLCKVVSPLHVRQTLLFICLKKFNT